MSIFHQSLNNGIQFLYTPPATQQIYLGTYKPLWVVISILLSIISSYAALNASARIAYQQDTITKIIWGSISAITLGFGVWSMHFIGMLAFHIDCNIYYDPLTTFVSILPGIVASGAALSVGVNDRTKRSPFFGSLLLGSGIGAMHFIGMSGMRLEGYVLYDPIYFSLSIVVAIALSYVALRVKTDLNYINNQRNIIISIIMGLAVAGMHYTAMSATYFLKDDNAIVPNGVFSHNVIAIIIVLTSVFLALAASTLASFSRNRYITQQLRESEERWKFALEGAGDSVWDWNCQNDDILFSHRLQEIVGLSAHDIPTTALAWLKTSHPDDQEKFWSTWESYLQGNQASFAVEFRIPSSDATWKWILARGKLVSWDKEGKPLRVIGTLTDMSETKSLQAQLNQAQKLEAIGQLAAGVAHEINTPIQYIGSNLAVLEANFSNITAYIDVINDLVDDTHKTQLARLSDQLDLEFILDDTPKAIKEAQEGVVRVSEIVKAMKAFSHVGSESSKATINVHEALSNALIICCNSYKYFAEIETEFSPEINTIQCYASELNQVFLNLIVNAAHAIEEKNQGMGLIRISTHKRGNNIEILIQDNGKGISPEHQEKVFNLFFTTKEIGKGTGQGLALSHSIVVDKHHGKLFFESTVGEGTTFHIQLPINDEASNEKTGKEFSNEHA